MSNLSISTAWDQTKAILARDGRLFATVALALIVLPEIVFAVVGVPVGSQATPLSGITYLIVVLLGFVAQIALARLAIGPSVAVGAAISRGFGRLGSVAAVVIILMVGLMIVSVLLLMIMGGTGLVTVPRPGQTPPPSLLAMLAVLVLLLFAIFQLVFSIAAVESANPFHLIARAWELSRHHYLRLLAFVAIVFLGFGIIVIATQAGLGSVIVLALGKPNPGSLSALVIGLIAGVVQAAFTVVTATMLARIYVQLAGRADVQASVPSSGT